MKNGKHQFSARNQDPPSLAHIKFHCFTYLIYIGKFYDRST